MLAEAVPSMAPVSPPPGFSHLNSNINEQVSDGGGVSMMKKRGRPRKNGPDSSMSPSVRAEKPMDEGFAKDDVVSEDDGFEKDTSGHFAAAFAGKSPRVLSRVARNTNSAGSAARGSLDPLESTKVTTENTGVDLDNAATVDKDVSPSRVSADNNDSGRGDAKHSKVSFASLLQPSASTIGNSLSFFPLAEKSASRVEIPIDLLKQSTAKYHNTLYGYFLGPRLYFPTVVKDVKRIWGKFGFQEAMMNDHGFLFFRFSNAEGLRHVLEGGPWMIRGVPLFVFPWDPLQGLVKPEHKSCPLWVKLHNIPLAAFNSEGVSRIASALGKPKMMDDYTTSMCDRAWGRPGFAKVLVDVWSVGELKRELEVVVPNIYGGKGMEIKIQVEYLWEPTQCSHCRVFGHKITSCAKAEAAKALLKGKMKQNNDSEGFTTVVKKKSKGIVINEPRPNQAKPVKQVYVPVSKTSDQTTILPVKVSNQFTVIQEDEQWLAEKKLIDCFIDQRGKGLDPSVVNAWNKTKLNYFVSQWERVYGKEPDGSLRGLCLPIREIISDDDGSDNDDNDVESLGDEQWLVEKKEIDNLIAQKGKGLKESVIDSWNDNTFKYFCSQWERIHGVNPEGTLKGCTMQDGLLVPIEDVVS